MDRGLFLPQNQPSASNTTFPIECLKAAYERLQAGIDSDEVMFCQRRSGQEAEYRFCKTLELPTLRLPRSTMLKLWDLIKVKYDRTRFIPTAYLVYDHVFVVLLDTSKYLRSDRG